MENTANTVSLIDTLQVPKIDNRLIEIAHDYILQMPIAEIAKKWEVEAFVISKILEKREIKNYINTILHETGYLHPFKRAELMNKIIDSYLDETKKQISKKDIFDFLKLTQQYETAKLPSKNSPTVAVQVNNYERLMAEVMLEQARISKQTEDD